jgi:hypothetical protein
MLLFCWEVSVYDQLAHCFWACGKAVHPGTEPTVEQNCSLHSWESKERGREGGQGPTIPHPMT